MRVLFIGGTGLISTSIARQLLETGGHEITLFNRGKSEVRLPDGAAYETIHGDRKDYAAFEKSFDGKTYDVVVDMVAFSPDDSASAVRAFAGKCGQFIHCSTVCVYSGPPTQIPIPETEPYHSPGSYGKNKIACEELLLRAFADDKFPVTVMRPSHSYGEGNRIIRPVGSAETFISRLRAGRPLLVPGDGTGLWAACHVDDVAQGFIGVMGKDVALGEAYNITGDEWMTWNTYHEQVAEEVGGTFNPVYVPTDVLVEHAPKMSGGTRDIFAWPSIFNNDKIKRDGNYKGQTISWREGVRRTVAWMEANDKIAAVEPDDSFEDTFAAAWKSGVSNLPKQA